jgi:hypothetical protein
MSVIVHRCSVCGHPDYWARGGTIPAGRRVDGKAVGADQIRRCCTRATFGDPEIAPTWDADGQLETALIAPGEPAPGGARACACDDCRALYEREMEAVPA